MRLPRPQLHLSTCIVLMFVAGGLMWANLAPRESGWASWDKVRGWPYWLIEEGTPSEQADKNNRSERELQLAEEAGVPVRKLDNGNKVFQSEDGEIEFKPPTELNGKWTVVRKNIMWHAEKKYFVFNILVALALLAAAAFVCEWAVRRSKGRSKEEVRSPK